MCARSFCPWSTSAIPAPMQTKATSSAAPQAGITVASPSTIAASNTSNPEYSKTPPTPIAAASFAAWSAFPFISTLKSSISCLNSMRTSCVNSETSSPIDFSPFSGMAASFCHLEQASNNRVISLHSLMLGVFTGHCKACIERAIDAGFEAGLSQPYLMLLSQLFLRTGICAHPLNFLRHLPIKTALPCNCHWRKECHRELQIQKPAATSEASRAR